MLVFTIHMYIIILEYIFQVTDKLREGSFNETCKQFSIPNNHTQQKEQSLVLVPDIFWGTVLCQ